eukprot:SAG31_NODE_1213_length_9359_cov_4.298164_3_plen_104_part_00
MEKSVVPPRTGESGRATHRSSSSCGTAILNCSVPQRYITHGAAPPAVRAVYGASSRGLPGYETVAASLSLISADYQSYVGAARGRHLEDWAPGWAIYLCSYSL